MVRVSRFKRRLSKSYVTLGWPALFCGNYCLINHVWFKAILGHRAVIWLSAVACSRWDVRVSKDGFIMPIYIYIYIKTTVSKSLRPTKVSPRQEDL